ncbi:hypothetical protein [Streptomyces sp. NPDC002644]
MLTDWTISYNGVVLGDAEIMPAVMPQGIDGLLSLPDIRSNDLTLIQRDGLWPGDDYLGGRTLTLTLVIQGRDSEEFSKAITAVQTAFPPGVNGETPFHFKLPGVASGVEAFVNVRTRRRSAPLAMDFTRWYCEVDAELVATDPVIYAAEETTLTVTPSAVSRLHVAGSRPVSPVVTGGTLIDATTTQPFDTDSIPPGEHYVKAAGTSNVTLRWRDTWV